MANSFLHATTFNIKSGMLLFLWLIDKHDTVRWRFTKTGDLSIKDIIKIFTRLNQLCHRETESGTKTLLLPNLYSSETFA